MRTGHKIVLGLLTFLLLSPVISFSIRSALAAGTPDSPDSTGSPVLTGTADSIIEFDSQASTEPISRPIVYTITIEGAIGTVTNDRIDAAIELADEEEAELLVIFLDTPGGFTKPTWAICKSILNSPVPVCMYIAPSGARAGSAGVYMTYSSHFAAMAPSTNIGAAHPVAGSGEEIDSVMNEKITNDAVAQIKAAAAKRNRNAEWAEQAVRESVSITDVEALEMNVIDVRADDLDDLLAQLDGCETDVPLGDIVLKLENARTRVIETSWIHTFLALITTPDIAFILFSIGSLGIVLELYNPGAILPGVVGAISLILAFYAFQTLPINYAGLALIIVGIILFIAEIKVVSHGLLSIGGIIALFLGGIMLIDTVDPSLKISWSILITVVVCVGGALMLAGWLVLKASRRRPFIGHEGMIGKIATVKRNGLVYVDGALWKMKSAETFAEGDEVEVVAVDKMVLKVRRS